MESRTPTQSIPEPRKGRAGPGTFQWDEIILGMKRTTKQFVENVLENIIESIVITNLEGRLIFFNTYSEEIFGYRAEEVLNRHIVILGAKSPDVLGQIRRNRPFNGEIRLRTKEGRYFPAHVRCVPLLDDTQRPIAMVGVARDLTQEKEKERADLEIARLEAFYQNIISSLKDGIQLMDLNGTITFVNEPLGELLEYPAQELIGRKFDSIVSEEGRHLFQQLLDAKGIPPGTPTFETNLITKSGTKKPFLVSASPIREKGKTAGVITVLTNMTEMQRLKEELFQSEKLSLLGTLASEVAHEINNPLGGLVMAVQMLLRDLETDQWDPRTAFQELREIENDARRCKTITQNLLNFSRKEPEEKACIDIGSVLADALSLVERQTERQDITMVRTVEKNLPQIWGNATRLQQVIINIVKNASDAMPNGGRITLTAEAAGEPSGYPSVLLSIADTGAGIPSAIASHLFYPFVTSKSSGKGTGLGLAVSKRIVEEHGGRIHFECPDTGGTIFFIRLPAADKTPSTSSSAVIPTWESE